MNSGIIKYAALVLAAGLSGSVAARAKDIIVRPGKGRLETAVRDASDGDRILLRPGTYRIDSCLRFNGLSGVAVEPYRKWGKVVISGSRKIDRRSIKRLKPEERAGLGLGKNVRKLDISGYKGTGVPSTAGYERPGRPSWSFLFGRDSLYRLSRWPEEGSVGIDSVLNNGANFRKSGKSEGPGIFKVSAQPPEWKSVSDVLARGYFRMGWAEEILHIGGISGSSVITLADSTVYGVGADGPHCRIRFINIPEEVRKPGDCAFDSGNGCIYFVPQSRYGCLEMACLVEPMIELNGCNNISIKGISLRGTRGDGIVMKACADVCIDSCLISFIGRCGVTIDKDCRRCGVRSCELSYLSSGGVKLLAGDRNKLIYGESYVESCHIHHFNLIESGYRPAVLFAEAGNRVSGCIFHDSQAQAILLNGNDHIVEGSEFYRLCTDIEDNGAIYYGRNPSERGSVIRDNYFHDLVSPFNIRAIYHDDGACACEVYGNVFDNISTPPVQVGGGSDIVYHDNLFMNLPCAAFKVDARLQTWGAGTLPFMDRCMKDVDLPLYLEHYPEYALYVYGDRTVPQRNVMERNVFYNVDYVFERVVGDEHFFNDSFDADVNFFSTLSDNVITDTRPLFENPCLKYRTR